MQEEFRKIQGYDNYSISNLGNVKNKSGKIMRTRINTHGYVIINLQKNKVKYTETLHRLVALTFIPNPDNKKCVDHIDNNRQNNNLENLRWATYQENNQNQSLKKNKSGVKGVYWNKMMNKWQAQITCHGKNKCIGIFDTLEEAKQARMKEANKLFGEFTNACEKIIHINVNININVNQEQLELEELEKELERIINL